MSPYSHVLLGLTTNVSPSHKGHQSGPCECFHIHGAEAVSDHHQGRNTTHVNANTMYESLVKFMCVSPENVREYGLNVKNE